MNSDQFASPDALRLSVQAACRSGRFNIARPLLGAFKALSPQSEPLWRCEAELLLEEGRLDDVVALLDEAALAAPLDCGMWLLKARAFVGKGDCTAAAVCAAEAVAIDRGDVTAIAVLGATLLECGAPEDAVACLEQAVHLDPGAREYRRALAEALQRAGRPHDATDLLTESIKAFPRDAGLRRALLVLRVKADALNDAIALASDACRAGIEDACIYGLWGHALSQTGRHGEASVAYGKALRIAPADEYVRHLASTGARAWTATRAPMAYVETIFDGCAKRFEEEIIGLGYRGPGLIRQVLVDFFADQISIAGATRIGPVLDLGCGTGLVAVALSDLPFGPFIGVDISDAMLAEAAAKGLFERLVKADIGQGLDGLATEPAVVIGADVFCYFGELTAEFNQVSRHLAPGGAFVFTVECLDGQADALPRDGVEMTGWVLGPQGRYAHSKDYVLGCLALAGLVLSSISQEVLRYETSVAVPGYLVVAEKPRLNA